MTSHEKRVHEKRLKRQAVRQSKRLHKWRTSKSGKYGNPKIGPEGKDLAHHHGFHKLTKRQLKELEEQNA